jgi:hypothetical protein
MALRSGFRGFAAFRDAITADLVGRDEARAAE